MAFIRRQRRRRGIQISWLLLCDAGFALLERATEAVGLGAGLDDVRAVGDTVDGRVAQPGVGHHLGPLREWQVGRDDHGRLFGPFGDDLEVLGS